MKIKKENKSKKNKKWFFTRVNFSNSLLKLLGYKHYIWKNHEAWFQTNQILNDDIKK
jgi:hypothetical protein